MKKTFAFFKRHKAFTVYLVLVLLIVLVALFAKQIAPYDPTASKLRNAFRLMENSRQICASSCSASRHTCGSTRILIFLII